MRIPREWRLALASSLVVLLLGCGDSSDSAGGSGGVGGAGGIGGACDVSAVNACLDLQNCCRAILVNPVFFQSCNSVVLQCDEEKCLELLSGYVRCESLDL